MAQAQPQIFFHEKGARKKVPVFREMAEANSEFQPGRNLKNSYKLLRANKGFTNKYV